MTTVLEDKITGCLVGAAVGDALGGATETYLPDEIRERWGGWVEGIVPPYHPDWATRKPLAPFHKGDGHITDDTLMVRMLVAVYADKRAHLDAYDVAERLVPRLIGEKVWVPELETETVPLQRLALAEKYLSLRLHWAHVDPREAGVGNAVNCGAAMYMAPVGCVNAADPDAAYAEAIEVTGAHQSSFGREAAGVMAAATAAAMVPGATADDVVGTALRLAKDGTRAAIEAVCEAARGQTHWTDAITSGAIRDAIRPYDLVAEGYRDRGLAAHRPSRLHSIEELPVALGFLLLAGGDWRDTVLGGVNYGRDADSIATMGGALAGALGGRATVPADLADAVAAASRIDLDAPARDLTAVAVEVRQADAERHRATDAAFARLREGR
ncbi:ADP-ribosylglycohydrolase family protein [Georgenia sp. 10Sc9-8]|uniref:ADP-ribosylglycohydrolase family protein n=1 Tax=Georgenia halotolerans TaxID=3028317 RepID=A0ABT5U0E6_9MICO|nr:ADP-ribosylglycohydrolase family protein [Georgenia halotolerans]